MRGGIRYTNTSPGAPLRLAPVMNASSTRSALLPFCWIPAVLMSGCLDRSGPVEPSSSPSASVLGTATEPAAEPCAVFEVRLTGRTESSVVALENACDQGVVHAAMAFDRVGGSQNLSVWLDPVELTQAGPVVLSRAEWLEVVDPPGLGRDPASPGRLSFILPEDPESEEAEAWLSWSLGETITAGTSSDTARIGLSVHDGIRRFRVALRLEGASAGVPETPPDLFPASAYDNTDPATGVPVDVLFLEFVPETSVERRTQIVKSVGGTVIGGVPFADIPFLDGPYLVRVGTTSDEGLGQVIDALRIEDGVLAVGRLLEVTPLYRKPRDGTGWTTWQTFPDSADGDNRYLEAADMPQAWGCTVGGGAATIAVVDESIGLPQDLQPNVAIPPTSSVPGGHDHGTGVASVVGARGDNGIGMAGVAWDTRLDLIDFAQPSGTLPAKTVAESLRGLVRAVQDGSRVINASFGKGWSMSPTGKPNPASHRDSVQALDMANYILPYLRNAMAFTGHDPLFVIAAGNDGVSAFWSGLPILADSMPDRVVVVGAAEKAPFDAQGRLSLWSDSNRGSLVELVAIGEDVATLTSSGGFTTWSGTSFAAPQVTGTAALLLSQHDLTASELKQAMLAGATRGGRTATGGAGGYPFLNAHQGLAEVSETPGRPLCGNAVWVRGGELVARRGSSTEVLGPAANSAMRVSVAHGGRHVTVWDQSGSTTGYAWQPGGSWAVTPGAVYGLGGTYHSARGDSHDQDRFVYARSTALSTTQMKIDVHLRSGSSTTLVASRTEPWLRNDQAFCRKRGGPPDNFCFDYGYYDPTGIRLEPRLAMDPAGRRAVLYISRLTISGTIVPTACPPGSNPELSCYGANEIYTWTDTDMHWVDLQTGAFTSLGTVAGEVDGVGIAENGRSLIYEAGSRVEEYLVTGVIESGDCAVHLMDLGTGTTTQLDAWPGRCVVVSAATIAP